MCFAVLVVAVTQLVAPDTSWATDIEVVASDSDQPVTISAESCSRWQQGTYDVWHLAGNCTIHQGWTRASGPQAVVWVDRTASPGQPRKVIAYLEGVEGQGIVVDYKQPADGQQTADGVDQARTLGRQKSSSWFGRFRTTSPLNWQLPPPAGN